MVKLVTVAQSSEPDGMLIDLRASRIFSKAVSAILWTETTGALKRKTVTAEALKSGKQLSQISLKSTTGRILTVEII